MIPVIRQQFFMTLAKHAKYLEQPLHVVKKKKTSHPLHHYSLHNRRRIQRLREKRRMDTEVAKMLKKEVREHHQTRTHLQAALEDVEQKYSQYKENQERFIARQVELAGIYEDIAAALLLAKDLDHEQAVARLEKLQKLVKKKL